MKFSTSRFGDIEVPDDTILVFENGLPGFPDCTRFVVLDHDRDTPLKWLQCVERTEVAFLIVEPEQVLSSYELVVPDTVLNQLEWTEGDDPNHVAAFVILHMDGDQLTANLRAPIVVNIAKRRAHQLILEDSSISMQHSIGQAPTASGS